MPDPLWFKDAVFYEVHVKAFHDGNGDGIGDFRGLIEKLDYIEWLGVNELLDETLVLVDKRMRQAGTRVLREFGENLPNIHARANQLRQVFLVASLLPFPFA